MGVKVTEWRLKMSDNIAQSLSRINGAVSSAKSKVSDLQAGFSNNKFQEFASEIPGMNRGLDLMTSRTMLAGATIAGVASAMYKASEKALDYERGMAKINATTQLAPAELDALKKELMLIGEDSAGNFMRIPDAFEKINSQVNDTKKSLEILKVANQGAKAGFVDIDLAAGALAQTLSIVGKKATATDVMDTLLKAKAVGAGEFGDFANYLPQLIASGSNMNVGYKDVSGLFAYMTAKGQSAADSAMLIQNMFTALSKSDITGGLAKNGVKLFDKDGSVRDLGLFFSELSRKLSQFNDEGKSNFLESIGLKDAQAKNAFAVLSGDADKLNQIMNEVRNSTGELNAQLDVTVNKTRTWAQIGDQISSWLVKIGDVLLPVADRLMRGAKNTFDELSNKGNLEHQNWQMLEVRQIDERLSREFAQRTTAQRFKGLESPEWYKNNGKLLEQYNPKAFEFYNTQNNRMMAKLTGTMFGGDYDKWLKDQKEANKKEDPIKKIGFNDPTKKKKDDLKTGIENISGGGRSVRNVNVHFDRLVDKIEVKPQTLKEGTSEVTRDLEEMLVRAINGAEESVMNE